ncbi:MAG: epoxyqueuosine reductase [Candidatus Zixiibacteriota bacterium]|nr:MAG: epoxyqueuosine reductase [candidate division Zixibacteria bacterium]
MSFISDNMNITDTKETLRKVAISEGARLVGVCRVEDLRDSFHFEIKQDAKRLNTAISIGVPLAAGVMDTLIDRPNMIYKAHYQQVNHTLNDIAFRIASEINQLGSDAIPIPASQILKWEPMRAHLSHREIAYQAGLGWRGRNNLLVTRKFGSQIRLVTVLTALELEVDLPTGSDCNECFACVSACPARAIAEDKHDFDLESCAAKVREFAHLNHIGQQICGLCIKACPGDR